jgi:hypothetical protein
LEKINLIGMSDKRLNIISEYNYIVWLPEKTATNHAFELLKNYNICPHIFRENVLVKLPQTFYNHTCHLFEGHEKYKLMTTARNPYSWFVSYYLFSGSERVYETFYDFVYYAIRNNSSKKFKYNERIPDYFVRSENLVEDYSKIPFIRDSDFFKSGDLESFCKTKINAAKESYDFRNYYDEMTADLVYYNFSNYFDLLGYDKNSWKK